MQTMTAHRSPAFEMPRLFGGRDSRPALLKLWCPFLLWLSAVLLYAAAKPAGLVVLGIFATAGLFLFTMALIMPTDRDLRYRRFVRWHTIGYREIVECKRSFFPLLGYLKLNRFVPPWGRLYFVFYTPSEPFLGRSAQREIVQYVQDKMAGKPQPETLGATEIHSPAATPEKEGSVSLCALWVVLGSFSLVIGIGGEVTFNPKKFAELVSKCDIITD